MRYQYFTLCHYQRSNAEHGIKANSEQVLFIQSSSG